jgi:hypothetical protein
LAKSLDEEIRFCGVLKWLVVALRLEDAMAAIVNMAGKRLV